MRVREVITVLQIYRPTKLPFSVMVFSDYDKFAHWAAPFCHGSEAIVKALFNLDSGTGIDISDDQLWYIFNSQLHDDSI